VLSFAMRGPKRPGCGDALAHLGPHRRRPGRCGRSDHRRRFSGGTYGLVVGHVAPEAVVGGTIALVQDGDPITIDAERRLLQVDVSDGELAQRERGGKHLRRATRPACSRSTRNWCRVLVWGCDRRVGCDLARTDARDRCASPISPTIRAPIARVPSAGVRLGDVPRPRTLLQCEQDGTLHCGGGLRQPSPWRSNRATVAIAPIGLARSGRRCPAQIRGSARTNRASPSEAEGNRPSEPTSTAASSLRMSPNMFSVRRTSKVVASEMRRMAGYRRTGGRADVGIVLADARHRLPPQWDTSRTFALSTE